ncbi:MAG: GAF domain-containing protein [Chloroflexota bacterium]
MAHAQPGRAHDSGAPVEDGPRSSWSFIAQVGEVLAGTLDYEQTHDRLLDLLVPFLADMCSVHLLDDADRFRRIANRFQAGPPAAVSAAVGDAYLDDGEPSGPIHDLLARGAPLLVAPGTGCRLDLVVGRRRRSLVMDLVDLSSILIVPLIAHGRSLGVLVLSTAAPRAGFSSADVQLALEVARRAALAIESACLYREAHQSRLAAERAQQRLAFLAEASAALAASLDVATTLQTVVNLAVPTLADCCGVTILNEDGQLQRTAAAHIDPELHQMLARGVGIQLPILDYPTHPVTRALKTRQPVVVTDITEDERDQYAAGSYLELLQRLAFRSMLVVPLEARGRQLGALTLAMSSAERSFDADDVALSVEIAGRAAVALDNARLYREARDAQETLARQLELSDAIVRNIAEGVVVVDRTGAMTYANPIAEQLLGYTSEQLIGQNGHTMMHVRDEAGTLFPVSECRLQSVFAGGETVRVEDEYFLRANGSAFPVSIVSSPLVRRGQVIGAVTMFRDVSEERRTRDAMRESEARLQRALRSAGMVMWERDFSTGRTVRSEHAPQIYGRPAAELMEDSLNHLRLVHPEDRTKIAGVVNQAILDGTGYEIEYRAIWPDGTVHWLSGRASVFRDPRGVAVGISGTTHDITARKEAELERNRLLAEREAEAEELRELHRRLQRSLEALLGIHEVGKLLTSVADLDAMAARLLEIALRAARLRAAVLRRAVYGKVLDPWQCVGDEAAVWAATASVNAAAVRGDAATYTQAWTGRLQTGPGADQILTVWRVPLIVRGDLIGVLEGIGEPRASDEPTLEILGSIALQAATAVENARLYQEVADRERALHGLVQALMLAQEDERRRLASEIHDGFAQYVSGLQLVLEAYVHELPRNPDDARHRIGVAIALAQRTVQEIRRVLAGLRPTVLDDFGLARGLRSFAEGLAVEGLQVEYTETLGPLRLPSTIEITVFRLAQEALANVRKHAGVSTARLCLSQGDGQIVLEVQDSGLGFEDDDVRRQCQLGAQLGLLSMRERIAQVGGTLEIRSRRGDGTLVRAMIPVTQR